MNKPSVLLGLACVVTASALTWQYSDWAVIRRMRQPIAAALKDPESAQFRNERVDKTGAVCGEVNAKNSAGGYAGFKRYIAAGTNGNYVEDHEPLDGWSTADIARRKEYEAKIFERYVDHPDDFVGLKTPIGDELEDMATRNFFDFRWRQLCKSDLLAKS